MSLDDPNAVDLISLDKDGSTVILSLVETRPWGDRGELLPGLQAKLSAYLGYALDGQMLRDYPEVAGKRICFRLHSSFPPGPEERKRIAIIRDQ